MENPKISMKRLKHDMKVYKKNPIKNVFVDWNINNLYTPNVVIIGPKGTPYENGFYGIKFKFTNKFPFEPPTAKFITTDGKVRMNPNLYAGGKVCLSLLGTWSGPQWTSCQNLTSIILSIMTVLNENPINNEPGYQTLNLESKISKKYNYLIEHANIRVGVLQMIQKPPQGFKCFNTNLTNYFLNNYTWYEDKCTKHLKDKKNKTIMKSPIYSWNEDIDYNNLLSEIVELKNSLINNII